MYPVGGGSEDTCVPGLQLSQVLCIYTDLGEGGKSECPYTAEGGHYINLSPFFVIPCLANLREAIAHQKAMKEKKNTSEIGHIRILPAQQNAFCKELKIIIKTAGLFTLPGSRAREAIPRDGCKTVFLETAKLLHLWFASILWLKVTFV